MDWVIVDLETGTVISTKNIRVIGSPWIERALNDGNDQLIIDIASDIGFRIPQLDKHTLKGVFNG